MIEDDDGYLEDPQCYDPPRRRRLANDQRRRHLEQIAGVLSTAAHGAVVDARSVERVLHDYLRSNHLMLATVASAGQDPALPAMISALARALANRIATSLPAGHLTPDQIADELRSLSLEVDFGDGGETDLAKNART